MAEGLARRGHTLHFATPNSLSWRSTRVTAAVRASPLDLSGGPAAALLESPSPLSLTDFTAIHIRRNPPFDVPYVEMTWLLESVSGRVHLFNHPAGLRALNEKLSILMFPELCVESFVSCDPDDLLAFIVERAHGDGIVKPLEQHGGEGVRRLLVKDALSAEAARAALDVETYAGQRSRMVQPFDASVYDGQVRAFTVGGEPLAWCLKQPSEGQFLANTRAGAVILRHAPTTTEEHVVRRAAQALLRLGISFAAFDLLSESISEINLTSPRLLVPPTDPRDYYGEIAEWIESTCAGAPGGVSGG